MNNSTELPEILKYYIKEMQNPRLNIGTRLQYKTKILDISEALKKELSFFDQNHMFNNVKPKR